MLRSLVGSEMCIRDGSPTGQLIQVQVPPGCPPGSSITVTTTHTPTHAHHAGTGCDCCAGPGSFITDPATVHDPEAQIGGYRDRCCSDWCADVPVGCNSFWCTQCLLGQIWEKLIGPSGRCCQVAGLITCLSFIPYIGGITMWIVSIFFMCTLTQVFSARYQIPLQEQPHPLALACCQPCVLAQMARHMEDFKRHPEKDVCCGCYNPTLDHPHPNSLWADRPQIHVPLPPSATGDQPLLPTVQPPPAYSKTGASNM
eukprot:TRINITY_DN13443_c0_g1_i2.p1 TRINITY_DN13443_c0_g1~~TRINITY_DN13443_c0_g1_i2.p1  ORF type:complete len:287 (-),score=40.41 TRINITY_DN13443_c0_g1_i2:148-915(-)